MTYMGEVRGGVITLREGIQLPDGAQVRVTVLSESLPKAPQGDADLDPLFRMDELATDTGIPDLATNIDHYLYGHPKVSDGQ
jgi:hypothetical protein